jgi:hypothetical protein
MREHLELLGYPVKDRVTGYTGVVTSISFDLYGCVQAIVNPGLDKDGKMQDSHWFDTKRLVKQSSMPVMDVPDFEDVPGGQVLPPFETKPLP